MKCIFIFIVVVIALVWVRVLVITASEDHHHESACQLAPGDAHCNGKDPVQLDCPVSEVLAATHFAQHRAKLEILYSRACKSAWSRLTFRQAHQRYVLFTTIKCVPVHLEEKSNHAAVDRVYAPAVYLPQISVAAYGEVVDTLTHTKYVALLAVERG